MSNDDHRHPTPADAARDIAQQERGGQTPDRDHTHGGPSLGVTTDGRTGGSNHDTPKSSLGIEHDMSGPQDESGQRRSQDLSNIVDENEDGTA